ncbi:hypothetical protein QD47_23045 [Paenibacillus terrae]|uniref:DZANK-type domain-containing protein n=1 Tax=Paenibacillus terrae TaxID=159743 RepID=A0A0D7WXD3_9BACL|nr:hypothetical protein QD47_23045 [Paenibacillus terrae]
MATKMNYKTRMDITSDNHKCTNCGHVDHTGGEATITLPYCGACGKVVLDITQKFCCWCGVEVES